MMRTHRTALLGALLGTVAMSAHTETVSGQPGGDPAPDSPEPGTETEQNPAGEPAKAPEQTPEEIKAAKKAAAKAKRDAKKAPKADKKSVVKAEKAPPKPEYLIEKVKKLLTAAEVKFNARTGIEKLVALAEQNEVDISSALRATGSIVPAKYKAIYGAKGNNGDEIADAFAAMKDEKTGRFPDGTLEEIAERNGVDFSKWAHLNQGQQRMNLGNVLRAKKVAGEALVIGKFKVKAAA